MSSCPISGKTTKMRSEETKKKRVTCYSVSSNILYRQRNKLFSDEVTLTIFAFVCMYVAIYEIHTIQSCSVGKTYSIYVDSTNRFIHKNRKRTNTLAACKILSNGWFRHNVCSLSSVENQILCGSYELNCVVEINEPEINMTKYIKIVYRLVVIICRRDESKTKWYVRDNLSTSRSRSTNEFSAISETNC